MNKKLIPTYRCESVFKINYEYLKSKNIINIFFDLDNTLANPYIKTPANEIKDLIDKIKKLGFNIFIISNNHQERVELFASFLKVNYFYELKKPKVKKIKEIIKENSIDLSKSVFIGDQIMTDILMANKLNSLSILINPLTKQDEPITFFPRLLDRHFRKKINKKKLSEEM